MAAFASARADHRPNLRLDSAEAKSVNVFFDFAGPPSYHRRIALVCRDGEPNTARFRELAMSQPPATPSLSELRAEIDHIDSEMHRLLMERSDIIARLIKVKKTSESGSAFRPAREADMMRRLVERHRGILPLDTAESIWRVIIATFTYVQAPFRVHADVSAGEATMRDSVRFHFGFTVPLVAHMGPAGVTAAVAQSKGDLGLIPALGANRAWWSELEGEDTPKIIARLPFVERGDHPAGLPVYAIARPHPDAVVSDVTMWSVKVSGWGAAPARAVAAVAEVVAVPEGAFDGASLLISVPIETTLDTVLAALVNAGASVRSQALVGSHARRYTVGADGLPVPTGR
jgi:chorismate mutase